MTEHIEDDVLFFVCSDVYYMYTMFDGVMTRHTHTSPLFPIKHEKRMLPNQTHTPIMSVQKNHELSPLHVNTACPLR